MASTGHLAAPRNRPNVQSALVLVPEGRTADPAQVREAQVLFQPRRLNWSSLVVDGLASASRQHGLVIGMAAWIISGSPATWPVAASHKGTAGRRVTPYGRGIRLP